MNTEEIREVESRLLELSKEELLELIKSIYAANQKAQKVGLSQLELTKEVCLSFFKKSHYEPDRNRLNRDIVTLVNRVRRVLKAHDEYFEAVQGRMVREDGVPVKKTTLWKPRQAEQDTGKEKAKQAEENQATEKRQEQFKFPFRREDYPALADLLEQLATTLTRKAAESIKLNVDEMILYSAVEHGFFHNEAQEAFVKNYAHALIDSKVSSERKTDNDPGIRKHTHKLISLLKS